MPFTTEQYAELDILILFDLSSPHLGIKVHKSAEPAAIGAAQRLYDKGLITQADGGYLTSIGSEAAQHAHCLHAILS